MLFQVIGIREGSMAVAVAAAGGNKHSTQGTVPAFAPVVAKRSLC